MTYATLVDELGSTRISRFRSEFVWVALGLGLATVGGAVGVRLLTSVMSPSAYGELTLTVTLAALVHQSVTGPLTQAILRYFAPAHESGKFNAYLRGVQHLLVRATGIITGIALVTGIVVLLVGRRDWIGLLGGAFLLSAVLGVGTSLDGMQNAARHQAVVAWHQGLMPWLRSLFAFGLVVEFGARAGNALLGFVAGATVVLASQVWLFRRTILRSRAPQGRVITGDVEYLIGQMRRYAWPFASWGVLSWLQQSSDRWALQLFQNAQSVGIYAVLYQLGYVPMSMLSSLVVQLVLPVIFSRSGDGKDLTRVRGAFVLTQRVVVWMLVATVIASTLAFVLRDLIFALLVGPDFRSSSAYFPLLVLGGGIFGAGQSAALIFMSGTDTRALVLPKVTTAIAGVLLNEGGAYWFGVPGVVFANVLFGLAFFAWIVVLGRQFELTARPPDQSEIHAVRYRHST